MSRKIIIRGQRKNKITQQIEQTQDYQFDSMNQDQKDDVQDNKRILNDLNANNEYENKKQCIIKPIYDEYRQKLNIKFEQNQPDTIKKFKDNMLEFDITDISVYDEDFRSCDQYEIYDQEQNFTNKTIKIAAF
ncbi:hypothetical protein pb186bvf_006880 [Paramecium bursaria]